jgi:hypothetical protein
MPKERRRYAGLSIAGGLTSSDFSFDKEPKLTLQTAAG